MRSGQVQGLCWCPLDCESTPYVLGTLRCHCRQPLSITATLCAEAVIPPNNGLTCGAELYAYMGLAPPAVIPFDIFNAAQSPDFSSVCP